MSAEPKTESLEPRIVGAALAAARGIIINRERREKREITAEFVEKKSRFIALAAPVQNETDAAGVINAVRKQHRDANL